LEGFELSGRRMRGLARHAPWAAPVHLDAPVEVAFDELRLDWQAGAAQLRHDPAATEQGDEQAPANRSEDRAEPHEHERQEEAVEESVDYRLVGRPGLVDHIYPHAGRVPRRIAADAADELVPLASRIDEFDHRPIAKVAVGIAAGVHIDHSALRADSAGGEATVLEVEPAADSGEKQTDRREDRTYPDGSLAHPPPVCLRPDR